MPPFVGEYSSPPGRHQLTDFCCLVIMACGAFTSRGQEGAHPRSQKKLFGGGSSDLPGFFATKDRESAPMMRMEHRQVQSQKQTQQLVLTQKMQQALPVDEDVKGSPELEAVEG